jgi:hypothetical protein
MYKLNNSRFNNFFKLYFLKRKYEKSMSPQDWD